MSNRSQLTELINLGAMQQLNGNFDAAEAILCQGGSELN
jgi:hypothetical protein